MREKILKIVREMDRDAGAADAILALFTEGCDPVYQVQESYGAPWREIDLMMYSHIKATTHDKTRILYTAPPAVAREPYACFLTCALAKLNSN